LIGGSGDRVVASCGYEVMHYGVLSAMHMKMVRRFSPDVLIFQAYYRVSHPDEDNIFFGIVQRGAAMIMLKRHWCRSGAKLNPGYQKRHCPLESLYPCPDAMATEFSLGHVEFFQPLHNNEDGLRGFEVEDADGYILYFGCPQVG